jgi:hypothetical protein
MPKATKKSSTKAVHARNIDSKLTQPIRKYTANSTRKAVTRQNVIPEIPIKITVEVIIRNEYRAIQKGYDPSVSNDVMLGGGNCPDNKFSYSFEKENASVLSLSVEEFEKDNPGNSGEFTTCINDASPEPKVRVIGLAKENNAGGRVALTLKFLGKDVFTSPKEFLQGANGFLKLNTLVKLPV